MCVANERRSRCRRKTSARHGETGPTSPLVPNPIRKARLFRVQILSKHTPAHWSHRPDGMGDPKASDPLGFLLLPHDVAERPKHLVVVQQPSQVGIEHGQAGGMWLEAADGLHEL